jgi:hypothetical protein
VGFSVKERFSVEQMVAVPERAELGVPVAAVIRKVGITEQSFLSTEEQYVPPNIGALRVWDDSADGASPNV